MFFRQHTESVLLVGLKNEAEKLFSPAKEDKSVLHAIQRWIDNLQCVQINTLKGWQNIVDDDNDPNNKMTPYKITCLQQQVQYLISALFNAKRNMNKLTWEHCCKQAVNKLNGQYGYNLATNHRTVQ